MGTLQNGLESVFTSIAEAVGTRPGMPQTADVIHKLNVSGVPSACAPIRCTDGQINSVNRDWGLRCSGTENGVKDLGHRGQQKDVTRGILIDRMIGKMNMPTLRNKVALVTGASKGIGASIAKHLASSGATIIVNYASSKTDAERVVAAITDAGGTAIAFKATSPNLRKLRLL